jgi:hypothetical protein
MESIVDRESRWPTQLSSVNVRRVKAHALGAIAVALALLGATGCPSARSDDGGMPMDAFEDATVPDAGMPDMGFAKDAGDAGLADTGTTAVRTVRSGSFAPSLGIGKNSARSVQGRIPPPQSIGTAEGPNRKVFGNPSQPR